MKKRSLLILSGVFIAVLLLGFVLFETGKKESSEYRFSMLRTDLAEIAADRKESSLYIGEIFFNGIPLIYDRDDKCYFYSLQENNPDAFDPLITYDSNSVQIVFEDKEINAKLIGNNERIRMLIYDDGRYFENELVCTTLPILNIEKHYDNPSFEYDDCTLTVYDNREGHYSFNTYDGEVRIRGGVMTAEMDKPGLRIKLDKVLKGDNNIQEKEYDILGLDKDNEFVLYTCNIEKDFIRNVFTTNLWYQSCAKDNDLKMTLGMSYRYCEVFLNGRYWGLCALGNPIDEKRGYVDLNRNSPKYPLENIYKLNFFGDREKMDYEKYGNDYLFFIKTNEDVPEAWGPFIDYMKLLLYSDDTKALYDSVDLDNALDIYLFYNMTQAWDNAWFEDNLKFRNTYLVSKVTDEGRIRMYYVPWDLDRCWGHEREDGLDYPMDYTRNYEMVMTPIENLLNMHDPKIGKLIYEKYISLRKSVWSDEKIMVLLDECEAQAYGSGAFFRECERWPMNYHADNQDLGFFKEYVMNRVHFFDEYINQRFFEYN